MKKFKNDEDIFKFVSKAVDYKPDDLFMPPLIWKVLCRSVARGKNIKMTGPSGCGKTYAVQKIVEALDRPYFYFNLGATQDPRTTLIGTTQFNKDDGTFFSNSLFVEAIQTPHAIILLDELTRMHPEAGNILMSVLDETQRYLRLDEHTDSPEIKVAEGVTFIGTANVGNEYTATRVMDRALMDRFVATIEMPTLTKEEETNLIAIRYPDLNREIIRAIADISSTTRAEASSENPRITDSISTRIAIETASLVNDGFSLIEAAEVSIYPFFDKDGGLSSERTYIQSLVQKYDGLLSNEKEEDLFHLDDIDEF